MNRGLGHDFLKHIERTQVLLFVIDISGQDNNRPLVVFRNLLKELKLFNPMLLKRPAIIFGNKLDARTDSDSKDRSISELRKFAEEQKIPFLIGSAESGQGIEELAKILRIRFQKKS